MGEFFQQVHVWVVKNCTPWYMDGPDLIYHGTWMGHLSFKIGTWMGDGWWHFKIPRGTPLPRPKLSTPPGIYPATRPVTHVDKLLPRSYTTRLSSESPLGKYMQMIRSTAPDLDIITKRWHMQCRVKYK